MTLSICATPPIERDGFRLITRITAIAAKVRNLQRCENLVIHPPIRYSFRQGDGEFEVISRQYVDFGLPRKRFMVNRALIMALMRH